MPQDAWPVDRAAFERYWRAESERFVVTDETSRVCHQLLYPTRAPLWLRFAMPMMRLLTAGLLSEHQRTLYSLPWSASRQRRFERTLATISRVYRLLPRWVKHWPRNHYLTGAVPAA